MMAIDSLVTVGSMCSVICAFFSALPPIALSCMCSCGRDGRDYSYRHLDRLRSESRVKGSNVMHGLCVRSWGSLRSDA
jgi:hypothetical protein